MDVNAIFINKTIALVAYTFGEYIFLGCYLVNELEVVFRSSLL